MSSINNRRTSRSRVPNERVVRTDYDREQLRVCREFDERT